MQTLVSSTGRKGLLRLIMDNPEHSIGVREAARECNLSPASVSIFTRALAQDGIMKEGKPDLENPQTRALKIVLNVEKVAPAFALVQGKFGILGMGMYGSWAKGANNSWEDLAIWILMPTHPNERKSAEISQALVAITDAPGVSVVFLTRGKLEQMRKRKSIFYSALFNSYLIGGEGID